MPYSRSPQAFALAVIESDGTNNSAKTSQLFALAVTDGEPVSDFASTSQLFALAVVETEPQLSQNGFPGTSQLFALGVWGTGAVEDFRTRAWGFTFDGHHFYVLHLGQRGTWVCDLTTGRWSRWQTAGYDNWNAHVGLMWNGRIIAADEQNPDIWEITGETDLDESFKPITRRTTAIIPASGRSYLTLDGLYLTASLGAPQTADATVSLRYSDDNGRTFVEGTDYTLSVESGNYTQELSWLSLGSFTAPGRVIEIEDVGGLVRIDRADIRIRPNE